MAGSTVASSTSLLPAIHPSTLPTVVGEEVEEVVEVKEVGEVVGRDAGETKVESTAGRSSRRTARSLTIILVKGGGLGIGHSQLPNNGILKYSCCNIPF